MMTQISKDSIKQQRAAKERIEFAVTLTLDVLSFFNQFFFALNLAVKSTILIIHLSHALKSRSAPRDYEEDYEKLKSRYEAIRSAVTIPALILTVKNVFDFANPMAVYLGFRFITTLTSYLIENSEVDYLDQLQYSPK